MLSRFIKSPALETRISAHDEMIMAVETIINLTKVIRICKTLEDRLNAYNIFPKLFN